MLEPPDGRDPQTGNTYHFKVDGIYNQSATGMTVEQVWALVRYTDSDRISSASGTYQNASGTLTSHAESLMAGAQKLVGGWAGISAELALGQMKQLRETAGNLAGAAQGIASALRNHAPVLKRCKAEIHDLLMQKQLLQRQLQAVSNQVHQAQHPVESEAWYTKVEDFFGRDDKQRTRLNRLQSEAARLGSQIAALDRAAAEKLDELNNSSMYAYGVLPDSVSKSLPPA